jgi:hypothetical protein
MHGSNSWNTHQPKWKLHRAELPCVKLYAPRVQQVSGTGPHMPRAYIDIGVPTTPKTTTDSTVGKTPPPSQ